LSVRDIKQKICKIVKKGRGLGHVTYFSDFGNRKIYGMDVVTNFKFGVQVGHKTS